MKKLFDGFLCILLILSIAMLVYYVPTSVSLQHRILEASEELETGRGREKKQQVEYDEVVTSLPLVRAELVELTPLADALTAEVEALKVQKKQLKEEKKALEKQLASQEEAQDP